MIQTQLFSAGTVLNEFHLLTASECSHWCDVVHSASSHWKRRARGIDFYTLGAAYYLDVDDDAFVSYSLRLEKMNPLLYELFADLYRLFWAGLRSYSVALFIFMTVLHCQGCTFLGLVLVVYPHF